MGYQEMYEKKKSTVERCLDLIQDGAAICMAGDCNEPAAFCQRLHTIAPRVKGVTCVKSRLGRYPFMVEPGMDGHINYKSFFFGPGWAEGYAHGNASLVPSDLPLFPASVNAHTPCDVGVAAVCPMDENGNFQISLCMMWEKELLSRCRQIILEVNHNLPGVRGGLEIHIDQVTALYENDAPLFTVPGVAITPVEEKISEHVAGLIRHGDCIQLGIGGLPNAIAKQLGGLRDLGIHTEMFTDAMADLVERGVVTGARKNINTGLHIGSFAGGSSHLYEVMSANPAFRIMPGSYAVDPMVIMQNDNLVSINTLVEMDLTGQVCSESIGPRQLSGSGGAFAFAYGAFRSKGGRGILAFPSRTAKGQSKIRPMLAQGAVVTVPRNYVDYIVTEYGVAPMRGRTVRERAENLIAIAHPDVREELRFEAKKLLYI